MQQQQPIVPVIVVPSAAMQAELLRRLSSLLTLDKGSDRLGQTQCLIVSTLREAVQYAQVSYRLACYVNSALDGVTCETELLAMASYTELVVSDSIDGPADECTRFIPQKLLCPISPNIPDALLHPVIPNTSPSISPSVLSSSRHIAVALDPATTDARLYRLLLPPHTTQATYSLGLGQCAWW